VKLAALIALSLAGALTAPAVWAQDVAVTVSGKSAHLTFKEFSGLPVDLKPFSGAATITSAEILFATTQNEISYVVLRLSGQPTSGAAAVIAAPEMKATSYG